MDAHLDISEILKAKVETRDEKWETLFLSKLPSCVVSIENPNPTQEFDGWPYLHASTETTEGEPLLKVVEWLSERGIGLILNSTKIEPDYVFSYGMLWGYRTRGSFLGRLQPKADGEIFLESSTLVSGEPTEEILPHYVRKILRKFFVDQGILTPKIVVTTENNRDFDFCFSLESLEYPPKSEHAGILEALSWFFPPDYSLALLSESQFPNFRLL